MTPNVVKADVARGAGIVALSRLGALVEVVAQPAYVWMFGIAVYGVYTVLWAAVNTVSNLVDFAMPSALQRVVPQAESDADAHAAVRLALLVGLLPSIAIAAAAMIYADTLAGLVNAGPEQAASMTTAIVIFAPALPLWTFIEIATAAARARRAFGPEVRLRLFWEQCVRLAIAVALFLYGFSTLALVTAHTGSLVVTAALAVRLLSRYYDLRLVLRAPLSRTLAAALLKTGGGLLPSNAVQRFLIDVPPIALNAAMPGSSGAVAAGLFGIARKIATVPQLLQQVFQHVLAPLVSAQVAIDRAGVEPLYAFAVRVSTLIVFPLAALIIIIGEHILWLFSPAAVAALPILTILVAGRAVETAIGPARPILEMTGHRLLPTLNSLATLAVWSVFAWWLVPRAGANGMAVAVALGVVTSAILPLLQLRTSLGFRPFGNRFVLCVMIGCSTAVILWLADRTLSMQGNPAEIAGAVLLTLVLMWTGLRLGLSESDRAALGRPGVRLRLTSATTAS